MNEVYPRLVDVKNVDWQQRAQFFAITAQMMRRILVDASLMRGLHGTAGIQEPDLSGAKLSGVRKLARCDGNQFVQRRLVPSAPSQQQSCRVRTHKNQA